MPEPASSRVTVGRIAGVFGVRGWVRVFSYTDPAENILRYGPWIIGDGEGMVYEVSDGAVHGRGIIAHLSGIDDRDSARKLIGQPVQVPRGSFADAGRDEYYWTDLVGMQVIGNDDRPLGQVEELLATGANDVLVLRGERRRLVPFVRGSVVKSVDLAAGVIRVDWDADF
jgi:16S rRNA processing protein RimM